jgi:hypothetical protein
MILSELTLKVRFSFFDVDPKLALNVYNSFQFKKFNGRKIRIDHSDSKGASSGNSGGGQYNKSSGGNDGRKRNFKPEQKESWGFKGKVANEYSGGAGNFNKRSSEGDKKREHKRRRN